MNYVFELNGITYTIDLAKTESKDLEVSTSSRVDREVTYIDISLSSQKGAIPKSVKLTWMERYNGAYSTWNATTRFLRCLYPSWGKITCYSDAQTGAPVQALIGADGLNRLTISSSDSLTPTNIMTGVHELDTGIECEVELFANGEDTITNYTTTIRIDRTPDAFYDVLGRVEKWWQQYYTQMSVPSSAIEPLYSCWYTFHQFLTSEDILTQCREAVKLGMKTVIIDDGWETDDTTTSGLFPYSGDWQLSTEKIPDMKGLVEDIHSLGMKVMLWFATSFMGYYANCRDLWTDKFLYNVDGLKVDVLDPRYPEVRRHIVSHITRIMREWNLDGMKLDFVDMFALDKEVTYDYSGMDYTSLSKAVDVLMSEVRDSILSIKPDAMIEFRQKYVGPLMRQYGNMLRATDCPEDPLLQKQEVIDLRLLSGTTAVHSDMVMWDPNGSVEEACMQLTHLIFSVPQISVRLDKIPASHRTMLEYYLKWWLDNRDLLLYGKLEAQRPESSYTKARVSKHGKYVSALYQTSLDEIPLDATSYTIVNATGEQSIVVDATSSILSRYRVVDCMGNSICTSTLDKLGRITVPSGGMIIID